MTLYTTSPGDERAQFEAWRLRTTKCRNPQDAIALAGFGSDALYFNDTTRAMWAAWQARASCSTVQVGADALDAARYRWLRSIDSYGEWQRVGHYAADALDKLVDDAIASSPKSEQGDQQ